VQRLRLCRKAGGGARSSKGLSSDVRSTLAELRPDCTFQRTQFPFRLFRSERRLDCDEGHCRQSRRSEGDSGADISKSSDFLGRNSTFQQDPDFGQM